MLLAVQPFLLTAQVGGWKTFSYHDGMYVRHLREERRPLATLKTNLLYDLALTPGIGVEVPIGLRWSVDVNFLRGWWMKSDRSFCWQLQAVSVEGRYWLSKRMFTRLQEGWFVGAFAQTGFYDFQLKRSAGLQSSKYCAMAGASGGYAYSLGENWSLEGALGVGYFFNDYRRYTVEPTYDGLRLVKSGSTMRFKAPVFPLKVGVSLQWTITTKEVKELRQWATAAKEKRMFQWAIITKKIRQWRGK
jgi:hypothetical protein